ncbi:MAG: [Fe-Fe] hydrogenase large subunit C-terminal domain-containing protein [Eubacteriales bacterium]
MEFFHSVHLDRDKCMGCINCIKRCPTEAIRVRDKKARIITARCIDCGECIRICPHHAKRAEYDSLSLALSQYDYTIALPAPALYGQFNNLENPDLVLTALLGLGFDQVFEVSRAAELVSQQTAEYMARTDIVRPVISSACPAVTRLIRVKFPSLIPNVLPLNAPVEVAARLARLEAMTKTGLPAEKIGTVFLSPCPAKVTASRMPLGTAHSEISAAVAISDVYPKLLQQMKLHKKDPQPLSSSGQMGVGWALSSGEAEAIQLNNYLAADGIENVMGVLEDLEDEKFGTLDFIELNACNAGCVGGVLNIENPYVARAKLKQLKKQLPSQYPHDAVSKAITQWDVPLEYQPVLSLDENFTVAMAKMQECEEIASQLPGLDCGSCGAPTCVAMAEDVVQGYVNLDSCIYIYRDKMEQNKEDTV